MKDILQPLVKEFMPFAQERMGFNKPPRIFLKDDPENAQNPLGKTAYYDPQEMSVTLYINGRHPKDIMRSLSHELVHHTQNCDGKFDNIPEMEEGYAQKDPHLREMERQAYEVGNLCLRDWEDTKKGTIYNQNMNVDIQKEGKLNMSTKDWKNRELPTLLTEKWGFSFNLLTESQEEEVVEEQEEELDEGAASSGRELTSDREQNDDRRSSQKQARPMEEAEEKGKYDDGDDKDEKCDHVPCKGQDKKEKMDEVDDKHNLRQKKRLQGKKEKEKVDVPMPSEKEFYSQLKRTRKRQKMDEVKIRRIIRKLVNEAMKKKEIK